MGGDDALDVVALIGAGRIGAHIGGALMVTVILGTASLKVLRRYGNEKFLARPVTIALSLLVVQLLLGVAAYLTRLASPHEPQPLNPMVAVTVAHVACGALVFATTIVLTLRAFRVLHSSGASFALAISPQGS